MMANNSPMKQLTLLSAFFLASCSNMQNERSDYVVNDGNNEIRCTAPPADVVETLNKGDVNLSLKLKEVQKIALNSDIGIERKYEKIREIDPQLQTVETVHYRLCVEYANKTFTKEEYKEIIRGLPLYNVAPQSRPTGTRAETSNPDLPKKVPIAPGGTWTEESLGLAVKVGGIGGFCLEPCRIATKVYLEITTSSFIMPNYEGEKGSSIAFTHNNKTYKLTIEEVKLKPGYIVISIDKIAT